MEKGLHGSDSQYTFVYAFFSLGGVLAAMVLARRSRISLRSIVNAAAMVGMAMLALFFVPNVLAACAVATVLGGVGVAYMSSTTAIVQLQPDRAMIGRVIALQTILQIGTTPIEGPILPQPFLPVNGKGGEDLAGPYEVIEGWPKPIEEGWRMASPSASVVFSADEVVVTSHFGQSRERLTPLVWGRNVFQMEGSPMGTYGRLEKKPEHFVVTFDRNGALIDSWTKNDHMFGKVNRIFSDPNDRGRHLWISDSKRQKIFKFTRDGDLVMQIGEIEAHSVPENPWKAEDIAWLPNGDFYTVGWPGSTASMRPGNCRLRCSARAPGPASSPTSTGSFSTPSGTAFSWPIAGTPAFRCLTTNGISSRSGRTSMRPMR
jgi:hypothetical protein